MNDFKKVFSVVVSHCTEQRSRQLTNCFETIAMESRIPIEDLELYLGLMAEFGHIEYSVADKSINLTTRGSISDTDRQYRAGAY